MSKKIASAAISVTVALGLMGVAPASAEDVEVEVVEDIAVDESIGNVRAAAAHARKVARELEKLERDTSEDEAEEDGAEEAAEEAEDDADDADDADEIEKAKESLQAVIDRLSEEGAGGNGVAAKVLQAILDGESPSGIGAEHGKEMAAAAKERRDERKAARDEAGHGKPDRPGKLDNGKPDNGKPDNGKGRNSGS